METKGQTRRQETSDSLAGASRVVPQQRTAPSLGLRGTPPATINPVSASIARSLQGFASASLTSLANKENERALLDGQMAYQQGKAIEDVDMGGNKWALEGYRVMQAQTISSSMLAAQQTLISQKGYEDDPDTFRKQYTSQLEQQVDGLDQNTARMVRETMTKQMPILVSQHTAAHLQYKEEQNFKSLEQSIDTVSKDPTATATLLNMANGGAGSISEGLSDDRRSKAVAQGVIAAFNNGNPQAYSKLKQAGALEQLSNTDKERIKGAQEKYQQELRRTYNEEYTAKRMELANEISTGSMTGPQAREAYAQLMADYDMQITGAESNAAYVAAEDATQAAIEGDTYLLNQAKAMGDTETANRIQARIKRQGGPRPMTAEARTARIKEVFQEIQEATDQQAELDMRVSQVAIDRALDEGQINAKQYLERTNANRIANGVKQTKALTGRTINAIEKAHKSTMDVVEANQREALDARYQAIKAEYEFNVSQEVTPDEAVDLATEFRANVVQMYSEQGVSLKDMNFSQVTANTLGQMYKAIDSGMKQQAEDQVIARAAATGTVEFLTPTQQKRYFEKTTQGVAQQVDAEITKGALDPKAKQQVIEKGLLGTYLQAGTVDPQVRNESIAIMRNPNYIDKDRNVNPNVLRTVEQYAKLKQADFVVAGTMLDEESQVKMDQIIEASGGLTGNFQDGILNYVTMKEKVGGFEENRPEITKRTRRRISSAVKKSINATDVGIFQVAFTDATRDQLSDRTPQERAILRSRETRDKLSALVEQEVMRRSIIDPGSDPALHVKAAAADVSSRVSVVGGFRDSRDSNIGGSSLVIMNKGKGIKQQLFGSKLNKQTGQTTNEVDTYDRADIENEVIVDHLQRLSKQEGFEYIAEVGTSRQFASNVAELLPDAIPFVPNDTDLGFTGPDLNLIRGVRERGVRPFVIIGNGDNIAVRVRTETGVLGEPIALDLQQIGRDYMSRYDSNLASKGMLPF